MLITAPVESPGRTSPAALCPMSGAASREARASSSLKSLNPASFNFRQNRDTVDTATPHWALRSVMLTYWVSSWCSRT